MQLLTTEFKLLSYLVRNPHQPPHRGDLGASDYLPKHLSALGRLHAKIFQGNRYR